MYLSTPICAAPLAPPPDKTTPTFGLGAIFVESLEYAVSGIINNSATHINLVNFIIFIIQSIIKQR
jgi:hypothetical protein